LRNLDAKSFMIIEAPHGGRCKNIPHVIRKAFGVYCTYSNSRGV
jgi:hypothetical protein